MKRKTRRDTAAQEEEEDSKPIKKNPSLEKNIILSNNISIEDSESSRTQNPSRDKVTGEIDLSQFLFPQKKSKTEADEKKSKAGGKKVKVPESIKTVQDENSPPKKKKVIDTKKNTKKPSKSTEEKPAPKSQKNRKMEEEKPKKKAENSKKSAPKSKKGKSKDVDSSFSEEQDQSENESEVSLASENDSFNENSEEKPKRGSRKTNAKSNSKADKPKSSKGKKKSSNQSTEKVSGSFILKKDDPNRSRPPYSSMDDEEESMMVDEGLGNPSAKFELPAFLESDLRDAKGKKPSESGYDPTTVLISEKEYKSLSVSMKQYWDVKKVNFDKLVALNMFDFYWFYYNDAILVSKLLDQRLSVLKNGKIFCCMACRHFRQLVPTLLDQGHKVVLVERVSDRMEIFEKKKDKKNKEELVRREVCQILTRGTYIDHNELDYSSRYALCLFEYQLKFGIIFLDTTTQEFHIGEFKDDVNRTHLRTILTRIKPIEIIFYNEYISPETLNVAKNLSTKPCLTPMTLIKPKEFDLIFHNVSRYKPELPKILEQMKNSIAEGMKRKNSKFETIKYFTSCQALYLCLEYLEEILLADTVFTMGEFHDYDETIQKKGTLYLDGQALENLEVLDIGYINLLSESYSLFGFMDNTASPYGRRMFKRWITGPLLEPKDIEARIEAVDDLINFSEIADVFQDRVKKLPDLERIINRIYNLTDKKRMMTNHQEDFAINRLKDFINFLPELRKVEEIMTLFEKYIPKFKSERLKQLCTLRDIDIESFKSKKSGAQKSTNSNGLFPRISHIIDDLEKMVTITDGILLPAPGICKEMDKVQDKIKAIRAKLDKILEEKRKQFGSKDINFVTGRRRYELEFPENIIDHAKRPKDLIITSKRKGFLRYQTPQIEELVEQLVPLDYEFQREIVPFIIDYFKLFYTRNAHWRQVVTCLSEIDCLCSLAKFAKKLPVKCKPIVYSMSQNIKFELKDMVHPMAARNNPNFVANSFKLQEPIFLITGPNMGGKSTFLRMICIAVIMAQMGSYVPAVNFKLSAVDRIFTRIGASDRITEGKSTFFVEMEETFNIVTQATKNSLVILDELGRGTSTYDGVSIAYATLKYISEKINCITLFATHYHFLIEEFSVYENIKSYYMESEFDEKSEVIKFKYKFVPGKADRSHGIVMGKMAGLPESVLESAKEKEKFMTQEKRNISFEKNLMEKFAKIITELNGLENKSLDKKVVEHTFHELEF